MHFFSLKKVKILLGPENLTISQRGPHRLPCVLADSASGLCIDQMGQNLETELWFMQKSGQ